MRTLRHAALLKLKAGQTIIEEVLNTSRLITYLQGQKVTRED